MREVKGRERKWEREKNHIFIILLKLPYFLNYYPLSFCYNVFYTLFFHGLEITRSKNTHYYFLYILTISHLLEEQRLPINRIETCWFITRVVNHQPKWTRLHSLINYYDFVMLSMWELKWDFKVLHFIDVNCCFLPIDI